jgi:hypothetical protein
VFRQGGKSKGILSISFCDARSSFQCSYRHCQDTNLTSRGVPARLRIFTTACTPLACSKVRRAIGESTRMHKSVSRIVDVK